MNKTPVLNESVVVNEGRRDLLKSGVALTLAVSLPSIGRAQAISGASVVKEGAWEANAFVIVAPDNTVTVIIKHLDKGQGAATGLATLVAEELDASWGQIRTEFAPSDPMKYKNLAFGVQGVGGSNGLSNSFDQYRRAGATARAMIIAAAAQEWGVKPEEVTLSQGVASIKIGKTATFGALAERAAGQSVPATVTLKTPD